MKPRQVLLIIGGVAAVGILAYVAWTFQEGIEIDARVIDVDVSRYRFDPATDAPLNVSLGETVLLRLRSTDVTHGFAIPEYGVNVEVPAGQVVEVRLVAKKPGDFAIYCTVFCGTGHPEHRGTLHVA